MRILQLTPGTGSFHCGSCLRDHALIKALRDLGHDAQMIPLYLPHVVDATDGTKDQPVFFGGINAYLQQKSAFFRKTPRWLDKLFDSRGLLLQASKKAGMTSPEELGSMTLSMLKGEEGHQIKELERLVSWLEKDGKPDVISLSNVLLIGMARRMREQLKVPIVCTLQGEDTFIDSFPEPYKTQCWELLKERAADVEVFLGVSDYYGQLMRERMELAPEKMRVVYNGMTLEGWSAPETRPETPVLGYLARMCPQKGLHTLIDAFIEVKKRGKVPGLKLRVAGAKTPADLPYVAEIQGRLRAAGFLEDVDFQANISLEEKKAFLQSLSLLSVPALYGESFGLYIIEALAMGVPVLQPKHAAFPEILELTEGGKLFDPDDPEAYATELETMFSKPEELTAMGRRGHSAVHRLFGSDAMARAAQDIFQDLHQSNTEQRSGTLGV